MTSPLVARKFMTTAQRVILWKWLEAHGTGNAATMRDLIKTMREQITDFTFGETHVRHVMKEMGLVLHPPTAKQDDVVVLAKAIEEIYAQFSLPLPEAVTHILNRK